MAGRRGRFTGKATPMPQLAVFPTDLGWCGLLGTDGAIVRLVIGHLTPADVRQTLRRHADTDEPPPDETDWHPDWRQRLVRYAQGERVDFADCVLAPVRQTEFQRRVVAATRAVGYGHRTTYAQLAEQVGHPRAARAVGNVMASNRVPIIVPCHRVLAAAGRLGGFTAPQGVTLKQRMLDLEREYAALAGRQ